MHGTMSVKCYMLPAECMHCMVVRGWVKWNPLIFTLSIAHTFKVFVWLSHVYCSQDAHRLFHHAASCNWMECFFFISVINQHDAQNFCFTNKFISCLYMFRAHVLIMRRSKLHYTASGIIRPIGGHLVYSLREVSPLSTWTDRHDEANSRFSQFLRTRRKMCTTRAKFHLHLSLKYKISIRRIFMELRIARWHYVEI